MSCFLVFLKTATNRPPCVGRLFLQIKRIRRPRPKRNFDWLFSPFAAVRWVGHPRCHSCFFLAPLFTGEDRGDINRFPHRLFSALSFLISPHRDTFSLIGSFVRAPRASSFQNVGHSATILLDWNCPLLITIPAVAQRGSFFISSLVGKQQPPAGA